MLLQWNLYLADTLGECCSVRLIQGVRLIQLSIDNAIRGVKCHSNEQWKRLKYSQRLWSGPIDHSTLNIDNNLNFKKLDLWNKLYTNKTKQKTVLYCTVFKDGWRKLNAVRQVRFFNIKIERFEGSNLSHFRCLACWVVENNNKRPFNTGWQQ